jgi:branched-chain amino acid transport system permease protein
MDPAHLSSACGRAGRALALPAAIVVLQLACFPVPLGIWLRGALVGGLTGLVALGMALTYRSHRVVNFAHAELGTTPVVLVVLLQAAWGWPYALATIGGLAAAVALGAVVELAVVRRFARASRLVLTVATLGLAQVLAAATALLPRAFGQPPLLAPRLTPPFTVRIVVGDVVLGANDVIAALTIPVAVGALAAWLRWSTAGVAVRAAADNADRAAMAGIPVKRLHTAVWAVAALLAFVAVFLRAGLLGVPITSALGFGMLLRALTALMIGRLTQLGTIFAAGVALGVLELGVGWNAESPALIDPILALVIVAALVLARRSRSRAGAEVSSWRVVDEARPIAPALARLPAIRATRAGALAALVAAALVLPHLLTVDRSLKASAVLVYAVLGLSLVVLTGWSGQVSLGQVGLFACGAAVGAKAIVDWRLEPATAIAVSALAGAAVATVVGLPALRLRGIALAATTLAFSLATTSYLLDRRFAIADWIPTGRVERRPLFGAIGIDSPTRLYYLVLATFAIAVAALGGVRASRTGRAILAVRDNDRAAQAAGLRPGRVRLSAFALSGALAGAAGCLLALQQQAIGTQPFAAPENFAVFTMVVVGGSATPAGAAIGASFLLGSRWLLPGDWQLLASGAGVLAVLALAPGGLAGVLLRLRDRAFAAMHRRALVRTDPGATGGAAPTPPPAAALPVGSR